MLSFKFLQLLLGLPLLLFLLPYLPGAFSGSRLRVHEGTPRDRAWGTEVGRHDQPWPNVTTFRVSVGWLVGGWVHPSVGWRVGKGVDGRRVRFYVGATNG